MFVAVITKSRTNGFLGITERKKCIDTIRLSAGLKLIWLMAKIIFLIDMEEGHILATFGLAHSLRENGHDVVYTSVADNEQLVKEQGFPFIPILESAWPKGYRRRYNDKKFLEVDDESDSLTFVDLLKEADDFFGIYADADLFMISVYLQLPMLLLYHKFHIRPVAINSVLMTYPKSLSQTFLEQLEGKTCEELWMLRGLLQDLGVGFTSWEEIVKPLDSFPELVLCPRELGLDDKSIGENVIWGEPSIRKSSQVDIYEKYKISRSKKIVYASFGSQASSYRGRTDLFSHKIAAIAGYPEFLDLHFILRIRQGYDVSELGSIPDNLTVEEWIPQIDILEVASAAIVHGGLGTVKECIYYGVPMIVFPQQWDQPYNAKCVAHHKLGIIGDLDSISCKELADDIRKVLNDEVIGEEIGRMKRIFREKEECRPGAGFVESMLVNN